MSEVFNVSTNPHVRSKDTTQTIMRDVLIALLPASIFGIYNFGIDALIRIIVGIVTISLGIYLVFGIRSCISVFHAQKGYGDGS